MPTVRGYLDQARELIIAGDLDRARAICGEVLARFPRHVEAHTLLAEARREAGDHETARRLFLQVLSADPENPIGYWALGLIAEQQGDRDLAIALLERALEYNPGDPDLWKAIRQLTGARPGVARGAIARAALRQGLFARALAEYQAAMTDEPKRVDLRVGYAEALWRVGRYNDCTIRCEAILQEAPDSLKAILILADCYRRKGRMSDVSRLLRHAAALDPDSAMASELFADSDPPWVQNPPVALEVDSAAPKETPAGPPPERQPDWLEQMVQSADAPSGQTGRQGNDEPEAFFTGGWVDEVRAAPEPVAAPAEPEPAAEGVDPLLGDESLASWRDLLTLEVAPDPASQARLEAALKELGEADAESPSNWKQVETGPSGLGEALGRLKSEPGPTAAAPRADLLDDALAEDGLDFDDLLTGLDLEATDPPAAAAPPAPVAPIRPPSPPTETGAPTPLVAHARLSSAAVSPAPAQPDVAALFEPQADPSTPPTVPAPAAEPPIEVAAAGDALTARLNRARDLQQQGDLDEAVAEYKRLTRDAPHLIDQVVDGLRRFVYDHPDHAAAHRALGDAYMRNGRFQQAIDEYNWVLVNKRAPTEQPPERVS